MSHHAEIEFRHPRATSNYTPSTFLERGVAVPFTTPLLGGTRLRPGERDAVELIVPNPSGGRGVYIVPWDAVPAFCNPTLHDQMLFDRVRLHPRLAPWTVRQCALEVAQRGLAGRAAAAAAKAAVSRQDRLATITNFELLQMLVQQVGGGTQAPVAVAELEQLGRKAVAAMGSRLGRTADFVAAKLEELASVMARFGAGQALAGARVPAALTGLATLCDGVRGAPRLPPMVGNPDAALVIAAAELVAGAVRKLADEARASLLDLPALLRAWIKEPAIMAARFSRPEWLLDGWDRIGLLWEEDTQRGEPLFAEMADLVPATPREAVDWLPGVVESTAGIMRSRRLIGGAIEDWRAGDAVQDRIARNERLQARALEVA